MRTLGPEELRRFFPRLIDGSYKTTSIATPRYNCLAYCNADERHWWEPRLYGGRYYWPEHARKTDTLEAWIEVFTGSGYERTDNYGIEFSYEKVAIYVDFDVIPTHVAKSDGRVWKSKLGKGQDIEHYSLDVLEGDQKDDYGVVEAVLRRPKVATT